MDGYHIGSVFQEKTIKSLLLRQVLFKVFLFLNIYYNPVKDYLSFLGPGRTA